MIKTENRHLCNIPKIHSVRSSMSLLRAWMSLQALYSVARMKVTADTDMQMPDRMMAASRDSK